MALALVGHIKGGLGYVTIVAACLLAALSGSAVADAAALTALLLPMMVAAGHDKARSAGLIASAGIIAPIIPPSIGFVVFGVAANVSISKLFFAGIFPGLMLAASLWRHLVVAGAQRDDRRRRRASRSRDVLRALREAGWALVLPVIIIVGLKMGVFTPTEAGVVAAVYALFVSTVVYRELKLAQLYGVFVAAARDQRDRDVPGRRGDGQRLAHHRRQHSRRRSSALLQPLHGQPDAADDRDHGAGDDRRHRAGHDADDPDPHAGADAARQGGRASTRSTSACCS